MKDYLIAPIISTSVNVNFQWRNKQQHAAVSTEQVGCSETQQHAEQNSVVNTKHLG